METKFKEGDRVKINERGMKFASKSGTFKNRLDETFILAHHKESPKWWYLGDDRTSPLEARELTLIKKQTIIICPNQTEE